MLMKHHELNRRQFIRTSAALAGTALIGRRLLAATSSAEGPVASTTAGRVRGFIDREINVFKGIPYGDDTAPRRFKAALPPKPWTGTRNALSFGPQAPQGGGGSEDCLYLNVWTPGVGDGGKRPVMVYMHGGGFHALTANNDTFDGVRLCRRGDVVVVSLNHRLNVFGYLYLAQIGGEEFKDSGNAGQLDLVLALQWVRENIAEFGGNPGRVMLFGESGGGAKNATLMAMPAARGLFHRAATSSGEAVTASRPETATRRARAVLAALKLTPERIGEIKTVPMAQLSAASGAADYYGPVVDGGALPRHPFDPDAPPLSADIPMLVGTNHDESRGLIGRYFDLTWETLPETLKQYSEKMGNLDLNKVIALYRRVHPDYSASDVFFGATTDSRDWRPAVVEIERRAAQPAGSAPTYSYQLDWGSPVNPRLKAYHGLDTELFFDNIGAPQTKTGRGPEAQAMADLMSESYLAFARTGNPQTPQLPEWPPYDLKRRATMSFNLPPRVIDDPRGEERKLFSAVPYENPGT